ncbi:hypothetical protein LguiA_017943 [Lonicera macranthoides]
MYKKKLKDRHLKRKALKEEQDPLVIDQIPSDDEWVADDGGNEFQEYAIGVDSEVNEVNDEEEEVTQGSASTQQEQRGKIKRGESQLDNRNKGKRLQLVDEEGEWEDLESGEEEDDRAIRYDDDSMDDPLSGGENENEEFDEFFKPLDTDDSLFKFD